jgi:hypothetical protein
MGWRVWEVKTADPATWLLAASKTPKRKWMRKQHSHTKKKSQLAASVLSMSLSPTPPNEDELSLRTKINQTGE